MADNPDNVQDIDTSRTETFSDGVIAIIITIMVLELKIPEKGTFESFQHSLPMFYAYILSFAFVGIYWNNHHHLLRAAKRASVAVMWSNLHLLFWLSLIPFASAWVGEHPSENVPASIYGVVCIGSAIAFTVLVYSIKHANLDTNFAEALGSDTKGKVSLIAYIAGTGLAFVHPYISYSIYVSVAIIWFIPDRRFVHVK